MVYAILARLRSRPERLPPEEQAIERFTAIIAGVESACTLRDFEPADTPAVLDIFNRSVRSDFAAFPETGMDETAAERVAAQTLDYAFCVAEVSGVVVGFCLLRPLHPFPNMRIAGEVSYFIRPEFTRCGIGGRMLALLIRRAREKGMKSLVAQISSRNAGSIAFHRKNGFRRCGRIRGAGTKFGKVFDIVLMQKFI